MLLKNYFLQPASTALLVTEALTSESLSSSSLSPPPPPTETATNETNYENYTTNYQNYTEAIPVTQENSEISIYLVLLGFLLLIVILSVLIISIICFIRIKEKISRKNQLRRIIFERNTVYTATTESLPPTNRRTPPPRPAQPPTKPPSTPPPPLPERGYITSISETYADVEPRNDSHNTNPKQVKLAIFLKNNVKKIPFFSRWARHQNLLNFFRFLLYLQPF